ncbi:type II toxin-antitoxin system VapC family toxin [Dyadobacter jiangsuensis]|uniref:Putative nucleic acid-binding protein n=1 Tax=Dyadobacter jiangsuensis TaxID=1591085 RepID=A0A2P8FWN0_9BACT|nr:type II toxin-antitoxin system VapC family toxin [Dyadobacter jiangsuensis]PSL26127.1 putative nucleic acid-binding protein [Dyadobacter jiangsuensis]
MRYLDTDVFVNFLIQQNLDKHDLAGRIFEKASEEGSIFVSFLVLQELSFVLGKLNMPAPEVRANVNALALLKPYAYQQGEYYRAVYLAERVGFQHFNDCLHTAIAERNCDELVTFNKSDFSRIKSYTDLRITLL